MMGLTNLSSCTELFILVIYFGIYFGNIIFVILVVLIQYSL